MSLTDEQKRMRLSGIGGSEVAAVVEESHFMKPIDVWRSKVEGREVEVTGHMERGTFLEDGVAKWFAHRTGARLVEMGTLRHPLFDRVLFTPDRIATLTTGEKVDLSIKVPERASEEWGEPGTDEVPRPYYLQSQWGLLVLGALYDIRRSYIAAPLRGDLAVYLVEADDDIQKTLVELVHDWWRKYVDTKTPPPVDGSDNYRDWLTAKYPAHLRPLQIGTPEAAAAMSQLREAREARKLAELEEERLKNQLRALIALGEGFQGDGWKCTWKMTKPKKARLDAKALAADPAMPRDLIQKHTHIPKGYRRIHAWWAGTDEEAENGDDE